jgi:hypothetical protein
MLFGFIVLGRLMGSALLFLGIAGRLGFGGFAVIANAHSGMCATGALQCYYGRNGSNSGDPDN